MYMSKIKIFSKCPIEHRFFAFSKVANTVLQPLEITTFWEFFYSLLTSSLLAFCDLNEGKVSSSSVLVGSMRTLSFSLFCGNRVGNLINLAIMKVSDRATYNWWYNKKI